MEQESKGTREQENRRTAYSYRNLDVWRRAQDLALRVIELSSTLPKSRAADILARQIIRSSGSVAANIAEGHGRFSLGAFRNHLQIARGSACETDSWLDLLCRSKLIEAASASQLHQECEVIIAALTNRIRALDRGAEGSRAVREEAVSYTLDDSDGPEE